MQTWNSRLCAAIRDLRHCGCYRITDTWAQNNENGVQGLESVEYSDADGASEAWVASLEEAK